MRHLESRAFIRRQLKNLQRKQSFFIEMYIRVKKMIFLEINIYGQKTLKKIERIRIKTGINFIGVEGWAGHDADRKRGFLLLNGEENLIKVLLSNDNFSIYGLEDKELQENIREDISSKILYLYFDRIRGLQERANEDISTIRQNSGNLKEEVFEQLKARIEKKLQENINKYEYLKHAYIELFNTLKIGNYKGNAHKISKIS